MFIIRFHFDAKDYICLMALDNRPLISIVSPVYRAENLVQELVNQIKHHVEKITSSYEIILVEDGSPDRGWDKIETICAKDSKVKGIKLSRNFGQHYAITAGLDHSSGEWIIVMDCDLQDKPEEIPRLFEKAKEGFQIVLAQRINRQHSWIDRTTSYLFYGVLSYLTGVKQDHSIANFGIYHQNVVNAIKQMREPTRYFPTMVKWVGFKSTTLAVSHGEREEGSSNYNFSKRLKLASDIMLAFSNKPLILTVKLGFFMAISSFLIACMVLVNAILGIYQVTGYASIMLSIWFLAGLIILILGIVGLYISKIFDGVKERPIYIIDQIKN